jgi:hypothetical protein
LSLVWLTWRAYDKRPQMTQAKTLLTGVAVATLSLGFSLQPHPALFWESNIVIAAEETAPSGAQTNDDNSAAIGTKEEESGKMGKEEGTHTGANQATPPESDTQKVDQPPRNNPTTGD